MINLCFLSGTVKSEIDLKFIYNAKTKSLSKKHTSIILIELEIDKEQIVKMYAYDDIADWVYRNIKKGVLVFIQGSIKNDKIEILEIGRVITVKNWISS